MKTKKVLALVCAGVLVASLAVLAGCGGSSSSSSSSSKTTATKSTDLRFVTGGESGTYYAVGSLIAQDATNNTSVKVTATSSSGSKANVQDIQDNNAELGFCQTDVMHYAYNGTNLFKDSGKIDCFKVLAKLYEEQVQIVTCNPDIKTVADLKGKTVSIGAANSGVYFNAIDILGAYDIKEADIKATYQSFQDSADALKNGQIDAAFIVAGAPTTAITDLSTSKTAYLVALDDEHIKKLTAASPYYSKAVIAAGTYSGITSDVTTVSVGAVILVSNTVTDDAAYTLCQSIFDNPVNLKTHAKYQEFSLENAASVEGVPYNAGAAKYFKEKGYTVAAS